MVLPFDVPEVISDPIVDSRNQELSGMYSQDPIMTSARKTTDIRFRANRSLGKKNGAIRSAGVQAISAPREAVKTTAQNASAAAAPWTHARVFLRSCTARYRDIGMAKARMKAKSPGSKFSPE